MNTVNDLRLVLSDEMRRLQPPAGLETRVLRQAFNSFTIDPVRRSRRGGSVRSWESKSVEAPRLMALVAALLAVAIVVSLVFVARANHLFGSAPASHGPQRLSPYTIPSPPSVASGCSSVPRQWASSPARPAKMLSTTTGWAYGPMRTTDGGAHWLDVSPPSIPGRTVKNDEFFLDATHAWVAETAASVGKCVDHIVVLGTADAGRTWQQAAPISVRFAAPTDVIWTGPHNHSSLFSFVDAQSGWLLVGSGPSQPVDGGVASSWIGADWRVGDLYRTTDGGLSWTLVATNPGSADSCVVGTGMSFSSATTGWIIANCPGPDHSQVLVTHDGGVTWGVQALPIAAGSTIFIYVPVFFDQQHGLLFAASTSSPSPSLLVTSDGGSTWSARSLPTSGVQVDFMNPNEGWAVAVTDGNFRLYHTTDGGNTWVPGSTTSLMMPKPDSTAFLHFVDSKVGFLDPGGPVEGFFRTTDGGHTWTAVDGTVQGP